MTRKGGLGPALLPNNLEGKPDQLLVATILDGPIARRFRDELRAGGPFAQCHRCVFLYDRAFDRTATPAPAEVLP